MGYLPPDAPLFDERSHFETRTVSNHTPAKIRGIPFPSGRSVVKKTCETSKRVLCCRDPQNTA